MLNVVLQLCEVLHYSAIYSVTIQTGKIKVILAISEGKKSVNIRERNIILHPILTAKVTAGELVRQFHMLL